MSNVTDALDEICMARAYTVELLDHIESADWFRQPAEGVTCIAWQVGHLAVAQYGLAIKRIHGVQPEDETFISADFQSKYGKGSTPSPDPQCNATHDELRTVFDTVHQKTIERLDGMSEADLDEPVDPPHRMFTTKLGALRFCPKHELIHAGQIALLRRLLGNNPLR